MEFVQSVAKMRNSIKVPSRHQGTLLSRHLNPLETWFYELGTKGFLFLKGRVFDILHEYVNYVITNEGL